MKVAGEQRFAADWLGPGYTLVPMPNAAAKARFDQRSEPYTDAMEAHDRERLEQ